MSFGIFCFSPTKQNTANTNNNDDRQEVAGSSAYSSGVALFFSSLSLLGDCGGKSTCGTCKRLKIANSKNM
jgi:Na+-transporting NADH:ubiquinone oxidoreductase subunit NqrF